MRTYRIHTDRLVIRCWEPADAPLLKEAVDASLDHLRPWLPWAWHDPQTVEEKVELLRLFRGKYDLDQDYILAIFDREESTVLGGTGLHTRLGKNEREIGYWVRSDRANQGIISEAVSALVHVGFAYEGLARLQIHCDVNNHASAAIPRKLGFVHEGTLRGKNSPGEDSQHDVMIWGMLRDEFERTPPAVTDLRVFDVLGNALLPDGGSDMSGEDEG